MGNLEQCLTRKSESKVTDRPSMLKRPYSSQIARYEFLRRVDAEEVCIYARKIGMHGFQPNSLAMTKMIIELNQRFQLEYSYARCLLVINKLDVLAVEKVIVNDNAFKQQIRAMEDTGIRQHIDIIGLDFKNGLVLLIRQQNLQVQQYLVYFLEYLFYEIARTNRLTNHLSIVIDCQFGDVNPRFLNYLVNINLQHYVFNIRSVYLVNISVERISSEIIGLLNTPNFQYMVVPLSDVSYLPRYLRKSQLSKQFGGTCCKQRDVMPVSVQEATNFII